MRVIEHIIRDGSKYTSRKEWRVYIDYATGKDMFYSDQEVSVSDILSWYQIPLDCWMYQDNDAEPEWNYWWTMCEQLAKEFITKHGWQVEVL